MLNQSIILGRLVKDPELRKTASGKSVANCTIAVAQDIKRDDGTYGADFINCVAWGAAAEFLCRYFHKGEPLIACGRLQTREWSDDDGQKHYVTEINVNRFYFCPKVSDGSAAAVDPNSALGQAKQKYEPEFSDYADDDGDIPF